MELAVTIIKLTLIQVIILFGLPFLLSTALYLIEKVRCHLTQDTFGWHSILITAWIGVPIHEFSHAFMCFIFRHKIDEVKLFKPNAETGTLGYVNHSYNPKNLYQKFGNFLIGIAPLLSGGIIVFLLLQIILPDELASSSLITFNYNYELLLDPLALILQISDQTLGIIKHFSSILSSTDIKGLLILYLILCISSHMGPSFEDIKGASKGFFIILTLMLIANVILILSKQDATAIYQIIARQFNFINLTLSICLSISFIFSAAILCITLPVRLIKKAINK